MWQYLPLSCSMTYPHPSHASIMGLQAPPLKLQPVFFIKTQFTPGLIVTHSIVSYGPFYAGHKCSLYQATKLYPGRLFAHSPQLRNRYHGELPACWQDLGETLSRNEGG